MDFIVLKTTDGQKVHFLKNAIRVFEEVPASARSAPHIRVYLEGYKFLIALGLEEFLKEIS